MKNSKIVTLIAAVLVLLAVGYVSAGSWFSTTTVNGPNKGSVSFDLKNSTSQANVVFETWSSKGTVYGKVCNEDTYTKLGSYSSAAKTQTKINVTTPYRYVYVIQTTMPSGVAKVTHSKKINAFTW